MHLFILFIPLFLALNSIPYYKKKINFYNIYGIFNDCLFIIDIFFSFFTAYYNKEDEFIQNNKKIALHYLNGYFIFDLIAGIPVLTLFQLYYDKNREYSKYYNYELHNSYRVLDLLKLIKIIKCFDRKSNEYINTLLLRISEYSLYDEKSFLIFEIISLIAYLHITVCLHIFTARNTYPNWIISKNLDCSSFSSIYITSLYFIIQTITSVGYGDTTGNTLSEFIYQIYLLLIGIFLYSWIISSFSNYFMEQKKATEQLDKKLEILNDIKMTYPEMNNGLYQRIYKHLTFSYKTEKKDKTFLLDDLPCSYKNQLIYAMYKPLIDGFTFFKNFHNTEFINSVITKLIPVLAVKNDILIKQGEVIEDMIFVKKGKLSLEIVIEKGASVSSIKQILSNSFFDIFKKTPLKNILPNEKTRLDKKNSTTQENSDIVDIKIPKKKHVKLNILTIYENENFGELLMFLNKEAPFFLRVKSKEAELYYLRKIDATEICSKFPNIWNKSNINSYHNLKQIKKIVKKLIKNYCACYGINYKLNDSSYSKSSEIINSKISKKSEKPSKKISMQKYKTKESKKSEKQLTNPDKESCNSIVNLDIPENKKQTTISNNSKKSQSDTQINVNTSSYFYSSKSSTISKDKICEANNNNLFNKYLKEETIKEQPNLSFTKISDNEDNEDWKTIKIRPLESSKFSNSIRLTKYLPYEKNDEIYSNEEFIENPNIFGTNKTMYSLSKNYIKLSEKMSNYVITNSSFQIIFDKNKNQVKKLKNFNDSLSKSYSSFNINSSYENINNLAKGKYIGNIILQKKFKSFLLDEKNINATKITKKENDQQNDSDIQSIKAYNNKISSNSIDTKDNKLQKYNSINIFSHIHNQAESPKNKRIKFLSKITYNIKESNEKLNRPKEFYTKLFTKIKNKYHSSLLNSPSSNKKKAYQLNKSEKKNNIDQKLKKFALNNG